jgi:hypothetical protein
VCDAQAWTDEMNGARGRKIRPAGGGSVLKGSGGEGGPEGWAPHGGKAGEREGDRGAWAQRGAARWRGISAAVARP